jgi:hypothetical protein
MQRGVDEDPLPLHDGLDDARLLPKPPLAQLLHTSTTHSKGQIV